MSNRARRDAPSTRRARVAPRASLATSATVSLRRGVWQAENDEIDVVQQRRLGGDVLAVVAREAFQLDPRLAGKTFADAKPGGARFAVDENARRHVSSAS